MNELLNEIEANEITERENLAVIYKVESLEPIPNKDRIELVHLKDCGYTVICEKGHAVGDLVVFIKYDSIVPDVDLFSFMKEYKFRVKPRSFTERDEEDNVIKKIYSQGIVITFDAFKDYVDEYTTFWEDLEESGYEGSRVVWNEGNDVTTLLGIKKYIPPVVGGGSSLGQMMKKGDFPTHLLSKTDEDNLASRVKALDELNGKAVYFTQKSEGSSLTCYVDPETSELNVCTRNNNLKECEGSKFWEAVNKYNLKETLPNKFSHLAIQAELVGPKIQANHFSLTEVDMHVFNAVDITDNRRRLTLGETDYVSQELGLKMVKVVYMTDDFKFVDGSFPNDTFNPLTDVNADTVWTFERLQKFTDIQLYDSGYPAEGIVIRPTEPFESQKLRTLWSGKIINRDYKL